MENCGHGGQELAVSEIALQRQLPTANHDQPMAIVGILGNPPNSFWGNRTRPNPLAEADPLKHWTPEPSHDCGAPASVATRRVPPPRDQNSLFFLALQTLLFEHYYVLSFLLGVYRGFGVCSCLDQLPLFAQIYSCSIVARPLGIAHNDVEKVTRSIADL